MMMMISLRTFALPSAGVYLEPWRAVLGLLVLAVERAVRVDAELGQEVAVVFVDRAFVYVWKNRKEISLLFTVTSKTYLIRLSYY